MLPSGFPQALYIDPCTRKIFCYTCEVIYMAGGIFNADEHFEDEDEYGFIG